MQTRKRELHNQCTFCGVVFEAPKTWRYCDDVCKRKMQFVKYDSGKTLPRINHVKSKAETIDKIMFLLNESNYER